MKDPSAKPDYKKTVDDELNKIEEKTLLLNDTLSISSHSNTSTKTQILTDLFKLAESAQKRIQEMMMLESSGEEEGEDRMMRLLDLNDLINTVLSNYQNFKVKT